MERAAVPTPSVPETVFRDGLGERRHIVDPSGHETLEVLAFRNELASVPSFEFALRERVSRLANFRDSAFGRVRAVERLSDRDATLAVTSERSHGIRLSKILSQAEQRQVPIDINAALCLIRQLVPAIAMLHENARDVAHGALGPERLVVTPNARLVIVEYVTGAALEQLRFSRERYWNELRVAVPRTAGLSRFDHRVDVTQIGVTALSLILGRLLTDDEYPNRVGDLVASAWAVSARGGLEPLPAGLRAWLTRALQLDARSAFSTAVEAQQELEKVLRDAELQTQPANLEQFLARYQARCPEDVVAPAPAAPAPVAEISVPKPGWRVEPPTPVAMPAPVATPTAVVTPAPVVTPVETPAAPAASAAKPKQTVSSLASEEIDFLPEKKSEKSGKKEEFDWSAAASAAVPEPEEAEEVPASGGDKPSSRGKLVAIAAAVAILATGGFLAKNYFAKPPAPVASTGTLVINSSPDGAAVIIDGQAKGKTPLTVPLSPGNHQVDLLANGATRSVPVAITAGAEISQYIELPKTTSDKGQLQVRTEPSGATISVDGTQHGVSPLTIPELAPGEHVVLVAGPLGSVRQKVTVESGATASLFVPLAAPEGAPVSGWIGVEAPVEMQVFESGRIIGTSANDKIMMSTGKHDVEVVSEALGFRATRSVQVVAGKTAIVKLELPKGTLAVNAAPWAEVWIDGEKQGETPIGNVSLTIGPHNVVFRHPDLGEQVHTAVVTLKGQTRLSVDMRKK